MDLKHMATANPIPGQPNGQPPAPVVASGAQAPAEHSLVAMGQDIEEEESINLSAPVSRLPVELDVAVPVQSFRVRNLLALELGQIIETEWAHGEDMPLAAGDVMLAWSEFEVVETSLAVRITRLA
jgi:flagellar motor switch protein FliN/FliY